MKKLSIGFVVVCTLVLWDFAFIWWMGDGLAELEGGRRVVAEEFIEWAPKYCDAPAAALLTRHRHVWVGQEPEYCSTQYSYDVQLTAYTVLGLPLRQISQIACEEIRCP